MHHTLGMQDKEKSKKKKEKKKIRLKNRKTERNSKNKSNNPAVSSRSNRVKAPLILFRCYTELQDEEEIKRSIIPRTWLQQLWSEGKRAKSWAIWPVRRPRSQRPSWIITRTWKVISRTLGHCFMNFGTKLVANWGLPCNGNTMREGWCVGPSSLTTRWRLNTTPVKLAGNYCSEICLSTVQLYWSVSDGDSTFGPRHQHATTGSLSVNDTKTTSVDYMIISIFSFQ